MKGEKGENGTQGLPGNTVSDNSSVHFISILCYLGSHRANGSTRNAGNSGI